MKSSVSSYVLSQFADEDLEEVFDYTMAEFGIKQAIKYVDEFEHKFSMLIENAELGRSRPEIKLGLRSILKDSHIIFYCIDGNRVRIERILHGSRDIIFFVE